MLVLTRKQNEKIRIGDSIVITVVKMKGKAVRLGIEAPSEVNILRGELAFEIKANETEAKTATTELVVEESSQDKPLRGKTTSLSEPVSHRNPTSQWAGKPSEVLVSPSWPTALADVVR